MAKLERVILLGRKPGAARALEFLLRRGIRVPLVVTAPDQSGAALRALAKRRRIRVLTAGEPLYRMIERRDPRTRNIDLVASYLYWGRIREPLIRLGRRGCVNFHPAPLPDYRWSAGYNAAILDGRKRFGVSAHFIDSEAFDAGPIIRVRRFPMDPDRETAWSLERKTQAELFKLFCEILRLFGRQWAMRTKPNRGGVAWTRRELEARKCVDPRRDSSKVIHRKIRAFFFPPYHGATIEIRGERFTLLDEETLALVHRLMAGEGMKNPHA